MRKLSTLTLYATLPALAGFALFGTMARAQDDMTSTDVPSYAAANPAPTYASAPPVPTVLPVTSAPVAAGSVETRMSQLEQQLRDMTNQLEQKDFQIRQLQQNFDKYVADTNMRLQALESRGGAATTEHTPASSFDSPASDAPAATTTTPPQPTTPAVGPQGSNAPVPGKLADPNGAYQPSATPPLGQIDEKNPAPASGAITSGQGTPSNGNAAQAYDQAFGYLQQSDYTDAENAFRNFLTTYPNHPLAANAQYWLGETYFAQTQYSTAAKTFAKAFQDYPKGQKAPDALLKLAITLDKMGKKDDACLTIKELNKRFPNGPSSVLTRGQEEAKSLNCPA